MASFFIIRRDNPQLQVTNRLPICWNNLLPGVSERGVPCGWKPGWSGKQPHIWLCWAVCCYSCCNPSMVIGWCCWTVVHSCTVAEDFVWDFVLADKSYEAIRLLIGPDIIRRVSACGWVPRAWLCLDRRKHSISELCVRMYEILFLIHNRNPHRNPHGHEKWGFWRGKQDTIRDDRQNFKNPVIPRVWADKGQHETTRFNKARINW